MKSSFSSSSIPSSMRQSQFSSAPRLQCLDFTVMFGQFPVAFSLPRQTKIYELNRVIRNCDSIHKSYGPIDSEFACLQSKQGIEMMDYWLLGQENTLDVFKNKEVFHVVYVPKKKDESKLRLIDFEFKRCLGKGGSCAVYLVRSRRTGYLFALKQISKEYISDYKRFEQILRERKILQQLEPNPYTIYCHAAFESEKHLNFLTDYYPGGELFIHLTQDNLNSRNAKECFCEILLCMEFLHQRSILYRDLKPENILVNIDGHLKIADFGLSRTGFKSEQFAESYCGSPEYMAPEMVMQAGYGFSLDFYTIGVLLYEFMTGEPPYYTDDKEELLNNIATKEIDFPEEVFQPNLKALLQKMLHKNPEKRISSFQEIKKSPWLKDVKWSKITHKTSKPPLNLNIYSNYIHQQFYIQKVQDLNRMNLMLSTNSSQQVLFEFFKFEKPGSKGVLYGISNHEISMQRVITSASENQMKPTASKEPRTLKPNIKFGKTSQTNSTHQDLKTLNDIKPMEMKKKITLVNNNGNINYNTKRLSEKDKQPDRVLPTPQHPTRISTPLLKQNITSHPRHPILLKPKKTPNSKNTSTVNSICNTSRSKDNKGHLSLTKSDYKTSLKKLSSPSVKDLLNYQSQKRNSIVSVKSSYKIMLL